MNFETKRSHFAVLSDTHHDIRNTYLAVRYCKDNAIDIIIHFYTGKVFKGTIKELPVAVIHGHIPKIFYQLITTSLAQYIFHGHAHQKRKTTINVKQIINPGSIGGIYRGDTRSLTFLTYTLIDWNSSNLMR